MAQLMRTSNPALNDNIFRGERAAFGEAMTVQGTVNKTGVLLICAMATAAWSWNRFLDAPTEAAPLVFGGAIGGLMGRNRAAPPRDPYQEAMFEPPSTTPRQ